MSLWADKMIPSLSDSHVWMRQLRYLSSSRNIRSVTTCWTPSERRRRTSPLRSRFLERYSWPWGPGSLGLHGVEKIENEFGTIFSSNRPRVVLSKENTLANVLRRNIIIFVGKSGEISARHANLHKTRTFWNKIFIHIVTDIESKW